MNSQTLSLSRAGLGAILMCAALCAGRGDAPTAGELVADGRAGAASAEAWAAGTAARAGVPEPDEATTALRFIGVATIGLAGLLLTMFIARHGCASRILSHTGELVQELTRQKHDGAALRQNEEKYRLLFESSRDAIMTLAPPSWRFTAGNPATVRMFRTGDEDTFVAAAPWQLSPEFQPDGRRSDEKAREMIETAMRDGSHFFEWRHRRLDGEEFPATVLLTRFELAGRALLQATVRDVTDYRQTCEALKASEAKFRAVVDGAAEGILVADVESGRFVFANPAISAMLGYSVQELLYLGVQDIHPPEELDRALAEFREQAAGRKILAANLPCRCKDGRIVRADVQTTVIDLDGRKCCVGFFTDVTKHRRVEEQLRHAQKLEAVGQLAGGVAHEFNNLLMGVGGYAQLLLGQFKRDADVSRDLSRICQLAERGAKLSRQLLTFSRREAGEPRIIGMNSVVTDAQKMLRRLLPENIELVTKLEPELGQVLADPGQIEQILMNLVVNARDAMPGGGTLQIETANSQLDDLYASTHADVSPGQYASLTVADTGCGMAAEVQARLFEPFFTTKGVGKGTGLGLATLYGIVKQYGGHVTVYSEVGHGSAFRIYLPRVAGSQCPETADPSGSPAEDRNGRSETILLVEDETPVQSVVKRALEDYGYRVLAAANGAEAEALFRERGGRVDLLVTDWAMPGRNGRELHAVLSRMQPGLRVLYMSAYPAEMVRREGGLSGQEFIQKPFAFCDLARKVRSVLDASSAAAAMGCVREAAGD